jgi:hypothetical protein
MKNLINNTLVVFFLFHLIGLLASCGNYKLNRNSAATIIKEHYDYPCLYVGKVDMSTTKYFIREQLEGIIEKGLVSVMRTPNGPYHYSLTPEGSKYLVAPPDSIAFGWLDFKEVTGITFEDDVTAAVEYTMVIYDLTPFGEAIGLRKEYTFSSEEIFQKYDDGWRATSQKIKSYKSLPKQNDGVVPKGD